MKLVVSRRSARFARISATFGLDTCASSRGYEDLELIGMQESITHIALGTGLILSVPLVAMQFTEDVKWGVSHFNSMGALLFGTGLAFVLLVRTADTIAYRRASALALRPGSSSVWANAAVGIIGSDEAFNLLYLGALAVGFVVGALIARFEPQGMAWALLATALALAFIPVVALILWPVVINEPPGRDRCVHSQQLLRFVVSRIGIAVSALGALRPHIRHFRPEHSPPRESPGRDGMRLQISFCFLIIGSAFPATSALAQAGGCAEPPSSPLVVNVKDKGAKGDGKTDDTKAIQAAIDAVAGTKAARCWCPTAPT